MTIPKIIHIGWYQGFDKIPEKYKIYVDSWKKHNQDFKIEYWDNNRFINESGKKDWFPELLKIYNGMKSTRQTYALKMDLIKYFALNFYGGFWVDTDCMCINPIVKNFSLDTDKVQFVKFICVDPIIRHINSHLLDIWFIASPCGNPYWELTFEYIIKRNKNPYTFFNMTSICRDPLYYNNIHITHKGKYSCYIDEGICVRKKKSITNKTLCYHDFEGTWLDFNILNSYTIFMIRETNVTVIIFIIYVVALIIFLR